MLISEAFSTYETNFMILKGYGRRSIETYRHVSRSLIEIIGNKDIHELTLDDVYRWHKQASIRRRSNTVRNDLSAVRQVLKWLTLQGVETLNYQMIPVPKREDTVTIFLTPAEVSRMITHASSIRNKLVVSLLYSSGIRVSELVSLDRGQIRNRSFTVIGKGKKSRLCFIDERTEDLMHEYLSTRKDSSSALIISNILKERVTPSTIQLIVKNTANRAGLTQHVTPHTLRHSFASDFTRNDGGARHLQKLLGHASLATTMMYSHVADNELQEKYQKYHTI